ncbi:MAG: hypothetical protein KGL39_56900 [Patescibacteria group bacterium]|nr:hypothetical protein [Patescibacteria group bacterium]
MRKILYVFMALCFLALSINSGYDAVQRLILGQIHMALDFGLATGVTGAICAICVIVITEPNQANVSAKTLWKMADDLHSTALELCAVAGAAGTPEAIEAEANAKELAVLLESYLRGLTSQAYGGGAKSG